MKNAGKSSEITFNQKSIVLMQVMEYYYQAGPARDTFIQECILDDGLREIFEFDYNRVMKRQKEFDETAKETKEKAKEDITHALRIKASDKKDVKISGAIMCKNEQDTIEMAVASLAPFVQEIIVMDTGSKDRTIEKLKRFDIVRLYEKKIRPWNFSVARNKLMNLCNGDMIFMMDADEQIVYHVDEELEEINASIERGSDTVYSIKSLEYENNMPVSEFHIPKIFPNDGSICWQGSVHNRPCLKEPKRNECTNFTLRHWNELSSVKDNSRKQRNRKFIEEIEDRDQNFINLYNLTKLYISSKNNQKAYDCAKKGLKFFYNNLTKDMQKKYSEFLPLATRIMLLSGDYDIGKPVGMHMGLVGPTPDNTFYSHVMFTAIGNHMRASEYVDEYLSLMHSPLDDPFLCCETLRHINAMMLKKDLYDYCKHGLGEITDFDNIIDT